MARTTLMGALLSGLLASGALAQDTAPPQVADAAPSFSQEKKDDKAKGDEKTDAKDDKKKSKKDAKAEEVTVWIIDSSGKG